METYQSPLDLLTRSDQNQLNIGSRMQQSLLSSQQTQASTSSYSFQQSMLSHPLLLNT